MEEVNIIGDIGGEFDTLKSLIDKMPKGKIVLVGDLNDRGPKSKEVIEWAMNNPDVITLHSNHGDMFVDMYNMVIHGDLSIYHPNDFFNNGGIATLKSYAFEKYPNGKVALDQALACVPESHIQYLRDAPLTYKQEGLIVSHAAIMPHGHMSASEAVWNRDEPRKIDGKFQVFGHNSHWGLRYFDDWAVCIDTSRQKVLTGLHWPSKEIFQQEFI